MLGVAPRRLIDPPEEPAARRSQLPGGMGRCPRPRPSRCSTRPWRAGSPGRFPAGPTPPQTAAWPHIAAGRDVLVASPTGSGKTLTGFLVAIDAAYRAAEAGTRTEGGARGPLHLPAARAGGRRAREPARPPRRNPRGGGRARLPRPRPARGRAHRRHAAGRARRHEAPDARPLGDDARVALSPPHRAVVAGHAARRAHRHRRRGAHAGPRQAGQPSRVEPRAAGRAGHRGWRAPPAHRALGHPAPARRGGASALGCAPRPPRRR